MNKKEILDIIKGLGELLRDGILTQEEFSEQKKLLLSQLSQINSSNTSQQVQSSQSSRNLQKCKQLNYKETYNLYSEAKDYFESPFLSILDDFLKSKKISERLSATRTTDLVLILDETIESTLEFIIKKLEVRLNIDEFNQLKYRIITQLEVVKNAIHNIEHARNELDRRNIPDSTFEAIAEGFIQGATDEKCIAGASAGAALGTIFFPGIGTLVGGYLGGCLGGYLLSKKDEQVIDNYFTSIIHFYEALDKIFPKIFDSISESVKSVGIVFHISGTELYERLEFLNKLHENILKCLQENPQNINLYLIDAQEGIKLLPEDAYAHWLYASVLEVLGQLKDAINEFRLATELDSSKFYYWTSYISSLIEDEQLSLALENFSQVLSHWPEEKDAWKIAMHLYYYSGDLDQAKKYATKLIELEPENLEFLWIYLYICAKNGEIDNAANILSKINDLTLLSYEELLQIQNDPDLKDVLCCKALSHIFPKKLDYYALANHYIMPFNIHSLYMNYNIPSEKMKNAKKTFLYLLKGENLICYRDSTLFGSGKDGFAFSDQSIIWKEMWADPVKIKYVDINHLSVENNKIIINDKSYFFPSKEFALAVYRFLTIIKTFLSDKGKI
ncbi:MAG: hypothetical protein D6830_04650 [Ignavibacteria bacterium]|nr:MAG: hypothetical protein D6830_04650 [Ignavibacteria bacterium]